MASVRGTSGSKSFDFASDDILCSYEDYADGPTRSDPPITSASTLEFPKSRLVRRSSLSASLYSQPEESLSQDVIVTVEKGMKKFSDNMMRFLEGISSRLSQLELYGYNLDKSIKEMRFELAQDHDDADMKLKSLEKQVQEVHRSVQILRDKQELADAQEELKKLQQAQREASSSNLQSTKNEAPASETKKLDDTSDSSNKQLALALPQQVAPQQQETIIASQRHLQTISQVPSYYLAPVNMQNQPSSAQIPQSQYPPAPHYGTSHPQDISRGVAQPLQPPINQAPSMQPYHQNQQQWNQQPLQQVQPPTQSIVQPHRRAPSTLSSAYSPTQQTMLTPPETVPNSMPMPVPYSGVPPTASSQADHMPYGYGGPGRGFQQQPPSQSIKGTYGARTNDGYATPGPSLPSGGSYVLYSDEGGKAHHISQPPQFSQGMYLPSSVPPQNIQPTPPLNHMTQNPSHSQLMRNHAYNDLIEKLVSMGYRGDHVVSVIQRMEESGQPIDFNALLDRLNGHSSGNSYREWSG